MLIVKISPTESAKFDKVSLAKINPAKINANYLRHYNAVSFLVMLSKVFHYLGCDMGEEGG